MKQEKARHLGKSRESLVSTLAKEVRSETKDDDCGSGCCSCCCVTMMFICLVLGFVVGVVVGALVQRNGYLRDIGLIMIPEDYYNYEGREKDSFQPRLIVDGEEMGDSKCIVRMTSHNVSSANCAVCSNSRLLNVSLAGYADCNGLYTMSNLTSIWDSKRVVYERISGGLRPLEKRYIYWNAHFYGENFYGWSIGDSKSLVESGPFHSQGRGGVSNQPWQGSWRSNVSVQLTTCNLNYQARTPMRWDKKRMDDLQRKRQLDLMRNAERNREGK